MNAEATALGERVGDWSELKQGIEHEINAKQQQLQAEKDLLALQNSGAKAAARNFGVANCSKRGGIAKTGS